MLKRHPFYLRWSLACTLPAFLLTVWIFAPAPSDVVTKLAIALSEGWGLWLVLLALIGCFFATKDLAYQVRSWAWLSLALGLVAVWSGLMPLWTALHAARQHGVAVNIGQAMLARPEGHTDVLPETLVFNNVAGQTLSVDVYLPASQASGQRPAAIIVHGGGWYARDKSDLPRSNRWFVAQGFSVFDIQYRLAPQPNWQTALGDVKCAIGWVKRNADRFRIDPNRITLVGRSAGAHLALLAAYTPYDPLFPPSCEGADTNVEQVVAFYGPVDLLYSYAHPGNPAVFDSQASLRRLLGGSPTQVHRLYELNSPIRYVTSKTPRTLLFHGGLDEYVRPMNMTLLEEKLRAAGVDRRAVFLPCSHHGFDYMVGGFGWQLATGVMKQCFTSR